MDALVSYWNSSPDWLRAVLDSLAQIVVITVIRDPERRVPHARRAQGHRLHAGRASARTASGRSGCCSRSPTCIKLLIKEVVIPARSNRFLFVDAPLLSLMPAFAAWAVMSLWPGFSVANVDAGVLYVLALAGFGAYGIILAGWAANSKYAFLGAMRSAAQIVAYEIAMGFALVGVVMASGHAEYRQDRRGRSRAARCRSTGLAVPAVRRLFHLRRRGDQPRTVRRRGRRIRDRRRVPRRVFRHRVRALLPVRIREHDPDLGAGLDVLLRRLAVAV